MRTMSGKPLTSHEHYPAANAGLFTTAADYGRFCQMLLNEGSFDGRQYLRPETVKLMRTVQTGGLVTGFSARVRVGPWRLRGAGSRKASRQCCRPAPLGTVVRGERKRGSIQ